MTSIKSFSSSAALALAGAILCLILTSGVSGAASTSTQRPYFTDIGQMSYARFLLDDGEYRAAAKEFERLIEDFPASPLLCEAQFRKAQSYMGASMYKEAETELRLFLKNFSTSVFAPQAASWYAEARDRLERKTSAMDISSLRVRASGRSIRAVQVMIFDGRSFAEIERELIDLRAAGVDTIIVRVFHNRGDRFYPLAAANENFDYFSGPWPEAGVYFRTEHVPVVSDILPKLTTLAHSNGLKIFAWMTTRYADYGLEDREDLACRGYDIQAGAGFRCKGLDLFNPEAVRHIEGIYEDLASYDIDGILFQDDLVSRHNEGYGVHAADHFARDTGEVLAPEAFYIRTTGSSRVHYTPLFWKWASWKNKRLLDVAERIKKTVKARNPDVKFAINLMYENLTNPPFALAWLSQSLEESKKRGFDYYSIMAYHRQMASELNKSPLEIRWMIEKMVEDATSAVGVPGKVLIKLQTVDWQTGEPLANREVVSLIRGVKGRGDVSLAVVPYRRDFPYFELGAGGRLVTASRP